MATRCGSTLGWRHERRDPMVLPKARRVGGPRTPAPRRRPRGVRYQLKSWPWPPPDQVDRGLDDRARRVMVVDGRRGDLEHEAKLADLGAAVVLSSIGAPRPAILPFGEMRVSSRASLVSP